MTTHQLYDIIDRWMNGQITEDERQLLKARYLSEIGAEPSCKTCPSFWSDVKHHFRYQLKQQGFITMSNKKYMIADPSGIFFHYPTGKGYASEGPYTRNRLELTDALAEKFRKENKDVEKMIVVNPEYKDPKEARQERANAAKTDESKKGAESKENKTEETK